MTIHPSGRYLYVANKGSNTLSSYRINTTTGALTSLSRPLLTGAAPQSVSVDFGGNFIYVANGASNTVSKFGINPTSRVLSMIVTTATTGGAFSVTTTSTIQ